jgi:hypothetical protein
MDEDDFDFPKLKTPEEVAGYLALKHANGMKFIDVLELHGRMLTEIGRDYVKGWGFREDQEVSEDVHKWYRHLKDGAYFVLEHIESPDVWYVWEEDDSETPE